MRRIDILGLGLGLLLGGGAIYVALQLVGVNRLDAGIWTQALLVVGLLGWLATYLVRAVTHNMTYNQQLRDYRDAFLDQKLASLSPEELAQLQAEIAAAADDVPTDSGTPESAAEPHPEVGQ